mmetsp:Transcript_91530/g.144628  ORF Transcript_91530/g.144628 Transcript_91530/m.144628 type:complete len:513 (-) Transcript_91530:20-1558(-)
MNMTAGEGEEPYSTLLRTELPAIDAVCTQGTPGKHSSSFVTQWSTVSITGNGATCNDDDWGPVAAIPPVSGVHEAGVACTSRDVLEALRAIAMSLLVWAGVASAVYRTAGNLEAVAAAASLVLYAYELRRRSVLWTVLLPNEKAGTTKAFATCVEALRDASPVVDLIVPGSAPVNYRIAEWKDETRPVDPEGFAGAPKGLFLVSFPVQIFPGDPSEASALEFAQVQAARAASGLPPACKIVDDCDGAYEEAEQVDVRSRLRWPDSSEGLPQPQVLAEGSQASCLRPLLSMAILCLLGLVVDALLRACLTPLEWPVKKRIFTVQGYILGRIRFYISTAGEVRIEGDEEDLKRANRFWLKDQDWPALWEIVEDAAPEVARWRRARICASCFAGLVAVAAVVIAAILFASGQQPQACKVIAVGLIIAVSIFACAGLAGCLAHRRAQRVPEELAETLNGLAECNASWPQESEDMLVIEIQQLASEKSTKASQMPIGSSKREMSVPSKASVKLMGGG